MNNLIPPRVPYRITPEMLIPDTYSILEARRIIFGIKGKHWNPYLFFNYSEWRRN